VESYAASTHDNASLIRKSRPSRTCADDWKLYGKEEEEEEEEVNPSGGELEMDEVEPMQHMDGGGAGLADLDDKEIEQVYPRESARSFDLSATVACTHTISCFGFSVSHDASLKCFPCHDASGKRSGTGIGSAF
jgi:hypothetical protein